jgi:hypothetical protein
MLVRIACSPSPRHRHTIIATMLRSGATLRLLVQAASGLLSFSGG